MTSTTTRPAVATGRTAGLLAVGGAVLCFSISSTIVKWSEAPGSVIAFWRMLFAAAAWWVILGVQHRRASVPWPGPATWRRVLPSGILFGANLATFFTAVTRTSVPHAEFIGSLTPLLLVPAGALLFGEHPYWRALGWGGLSLVGLAIFIGFSPPRGSATAGGDLLVLAALLQWASYLLVTKRARAGLGVVEFMSAVTPIGLVTAAPIAVAAAGRDAMWPLDDRTWVAVGLLTVITGLGAHGFIVFAQRHLPVATIGIMQVAQPALATIWSALLLAEPVRLMQLPGMVLVISGLAMFTWMTQRRVVVTSDTGAPPVEG